MADSPAFEFVCAGLERRTARSRLEVRGTVRLALKAAGLGAAAVTPAQMGVVLDRVLPAELRLRGIGDPEGHCAALASELGAARLAERSAETPEDVFARFAER
jgi:hypothetical protein